MQTKYNILLNVLDSIRFEATGTKWAQMYAVSGGNDDELSAAMSRAFIHLYLKVMFGITSFSEREKFITDGPQDGGIDGFYVDSDSRRIFILQSKFRNTEKNFEAKEIVSGELLAMQIDRITQGHENDEGGISYNGKIQGFIRELKKISNIAKYAYEVVILANCSLTRDNLWRLTGGFKTEVFNFNRSYNELVFPIVCGTHFKASEISVSLDLNNKTAGVRTAYSVNTNHFDCEITVLFVPTIEIALLMDKYRNSILEFNPRSYLDLEGKTMHQSIRETLLREGSNEFALMNNGLTILSDETSINERIGQKNKAQITLVNPQIINGGQTAYTLSRVLNESRENAHDKFQGKEVLCKIITLTSKHPGIDVSQDRVNLIDEISAATNRQVVVTSVDRFSNEAVHLKVQKALFEKYALLYERKRGEFSDGLQAKYVNQDQILERNLFIRLMLLVHDRLSTAVQRKVFAVHRLTEDEMLSDEKLAEFYRAYTLFKLMRPRGGEQLLRTRSVLGRVAAALSIFPSETSASKMSVPEIEKFWEEVLEYAAKRNPKLVRVDFSKKRNEEVRRFSGNAWIGSHQFSADIDSFIAMRKGTNKVNSAAVESDITDICQENVSMSRSLSQ